MAHRGILAALAIGMMACGGKMIGDEPNIQQPPPIGWRSYTLTFTGVKHTWSYGPMGTDAVASEGKTIRFDYYTGGGPRGGTPQGVLGPMFGEPVALYASADSVAKVAVTGEGSGVSFSSAGSGMGTITERWSSFALELDADGKPVGGTASGKAEGYSGDMGWMGEASARITISADVEAPAWRTTSTRSLADQPLPWDERTFETSEPYERSLAGGGPRVADLLSVPEDAVASSDMLPSFQWSDSGKARGVRFRLRNWDLVKALTGRLYGVRDLAGNLTAPVIAPYEFGGLFVPKIAARELSFTDGAKGTPATWGAAKESDACPDGKRCMSIGPFKSTPYGGCEGSGGGIAVRLDGTGLVRANIRVIAKQSSGGSFGGPPPTSFAHLQVATPGNAPKTAESTTIAWPEKTGDGPYDTGWVSLEIATSESASETGIALGGGGIGVGSSGCGSWGGAPPYMTPYDVTIYVERIGFVATK